MIYPRIGNEMSTHTQNGSDDDGEFRDWIDSISASQAEVKTLITHSDYTLYQAKEHVRAGKTVGRPTSRLVKLLNHLQDRYWPVWEQVTKTIRETAHHHKHFRGHHRSHG
jgi:hypothetical protein